MFQSESSNRLSALHCAFPLLLIACGLSVSSAVTSELTQDGLEYTINQKDFKVAKFKMFGKEFEDTYGFVGPEFLPLDNRGYNEVINKFSRMDFVLQQ